MCNVSRSLSPVKLKEHVDTGNGVVTIIHADSGIQKAVGTRCKEDSQKRVVAAARCRLGPYRTEHSAVQKRHMDHILSDFGVKPTVDAFAMRDNARSPRF